MISTAFVDSARKATPFVWTETGAMDGTVAGSSTGSRSGGRGSPCGVFPPLLFPPTATTARSAHTARTRIGIVWRRNHATVSETTRDFAIVASGDDEYAFAAVHDERGAAKVVHTAPNAAKVTIDKTLMSPTNRVDVAVFARRQGSGWGAPSFVSFAVVDPSAPYSDPVLTHRDAAKQEKE